MQDAVLNRSESGAFPIWRGVLAGASASLVGIGLARFAYTPLLPAIIGAHWFPASTAAYLGAANLGGYLAGALAAGLLARHARAATVLRAMMVLATIAFVACAFPVSFLWFFAWRFLSGISGGALMVLAAPTIIAHVAPSRRGFASGAIFTGIGLGIAASGTIVPLLLRQGLTETWLGLAVVSLLLTIVAWNGWPPQDAPRPAQTNVHTHVKTPAPRALRALFAEYALNAVGLVPHMIFLVDFVARGLGKGVDAGAQYWVLYGLGAIVGPLLAGHLADRAGFGRALRVAFLIQLVAVALPAISSNTGLLMVSSVLVGAFTPGIVPLVLGRVNELLAHHPAAQKGAWSTATTGFAVLQALAAYGLSFLFSNSGGLSPAVCDRRRRARGRARRGSVRRVEVEMSQVFQAAMPRGYAERNEHYWRRNLAVCVFGSFTTLVSLSMLLPFLPLYVRQLGVESQAAVIEWSGVAFSATFLGTAVTAPLWGRLADRYGRKPMLVRAALGMAVVMSLIGVAHSVQQLVALRLLAGLLGGYASASTVMIGTQAPRERAGWALGILSTGALAGNLAGPLIGGLLPGLIGIRGTFFAGAAMIAVAAFFTIVLVKEDFHRGDAKKRATHAASARAHRTNYGVVAALLATAMMVLLANMSIEPVITVYIGGLGVSADHVARIAGVVMACSALGSMLTAARLGALADRIGSWNVIVGCLVLTGIAMIPQAFVHQWWELAALRVVMGMTLAGLLPSIAKLARGAVDENGSGQMLGYLQSAQFSGQVIGPVIGGQIGVWFGLHAVFFATGSLLIACAGLAHWARTR